MLERRYGDALSHEDSYGTKMRRKRSKRRIRFPNAGEISGSGFGVTLDGSATGATSPSRFSET